MVPIWLRMINNEIRDDNARLQNSVLEYVITFSCSEQLSD